MADLLAVAAPLMARQHALLTIAQAQDLGANRQLVSDLVRRAIWERADRGLYGPCGVPMTWRRSLMAAVLVAPAGSLVSHRAAAAIHGVGGLVEPLPELSVPRGVRFRRNGVIVHESTDLVLAAPCTIDDIPVTGRSRLAMDLGSVISRKRYNQMIRELRYGCGVTNEQLLRTYLRHKRMGRNGGAALRDWLDRYYHVSGVSESGIELVVLDAILDRALPRPVLQHWVTTPGGRFRIDLAYPELLLAIEVDGAQHDDDPDHVVGDPRRTAALTACGWTVVRIRARHLATDLAAALDTIHRFHTANCVVPSGGC